MERKTKSRFVAVVLAISILVSAAPLALAAAPDVSDHWAETTIERWTERGVIQGYPDGTFRPDGYITRAEFSALINRTYGYTTVSSVSFVDADSSEWYFSDIGKAKAAGYMLGDPANTVRPNDSITRQEVAVILARLLDLSSTQASYSFTDAGQFPSWSKAAIMGCANRGLLLGYPDNSFGPETNMTRAEVVTVLDRLFAELYTTSGVFGSTSEKEINGSVVVLASGVTLQNLKIKGDLLIAQSVGDGDVTLKNVTVTGKTQISGGGEHTVLFEDCNVGTVTIDRDGNIRVVAQGSTVVLEVVINAGTITLVNSATGQSFASVVIPEGISSNTNLELVGAFGNVEVNSPIDIKVGSTSSVKTMTIGAAANIQGAANIDLVNLNANGAVLDARPKSLSVASGVTGTVGGITVGTTTPPPSGGDDYDDGGDDQPEPYPVRVVSTSTPNADGTGSGGTNIDKYTVGAMAGSVPSYTTVITGTHPLDKFASADSDQGEAQWVGVLITTNTNVTSLAVKTPSMSVFTDLDSDDVEEAVSAGATGTGTFVWWLKAEEIGSGKTISIKGKYSADSTAVSLTVTLKPYGAILQTDAPTADGTGSGATNIDNYTVGTKTGSGYSYETVITGTAPLVDVTSPTQGDAKWVGVLITTGVEATELAVSTPSMNGSFYTLTSADVEEARAVGAGPTATNTFVWWLEADKIADGKAIRIKKISADDNTAVTLTVKFVPYPVEAEFEATGGVGAHDGKVYEEYELKLDDDSVVDLSSGNVASISVLKPGDTSPTTLTPNTDQTLWFDVQNQSGDYVFTVIPLGDEDIKYVATLNWTEPTEVAATLTGQAGEHEGQYYVEYKLGDLNLSSFDAMYEIKPDGTVATLTANADVNLWFKTSGQIPGEFVFLVKQGDVWYTSTISYYLGEVITSAPTADGDGSSGTNIGKYTVDTVGGSWPSFETEITATDTLVDVTSPTQGVAKWVGVLITTTGVEATELAVKTPSMSSFYALTEADVAEAVSAGATGTNTFVWWLKSEDFIEGESKDILIKLQDKADDTAVTLTVTFVPFVEP